MWREISGQISNADVGIERNNGSASKSKLYPLALTCIE